MLFLILASFDFFFGDCDFEREKKSNQLIKPLCKTYLFYFLVSFLMVRTKTFDLFSHQELQNHQAARDTPLSPIYKVFYLEFGLINLPTANSFNYSYTNLGFCSKRVSLTLECIAHVFLPCYPWVIRSVHSDLLS